MVSLSADLSGIGNYIGAVDGIITALQDPRIQGNFIGKIQDKTRKVFYVETLVAAQVGGSRVKHVYEWGQQQGTITEQRLYRLTKHGQGADRLMSYHFLPSTAPVPLPDKRYGFPSSSKRGNSLRRHTFTMKALVMETKSSVTIAPVRAKALFIPVEGNKKGFVMTHKEVEINPGGEAATGGFASWWTQWFETRAQAIATEESHKAEEVVAATGQKVIRHLAGTRIAGKAVGGQFATAQGVSYGYINGKKQNAEMEARNTFQRVWDEDEEVDE